MPYWYEISRLVESIVEVLPGQNILQTDHDSEGKA